MALHLTQLFGGGTSLKGAHGQLARIGLLNPMRGTGRAASIKGVLRLLRQNILGMRGIIDVLRYCKLYANSKENGDEVITCGRLLSPTIHSHAYLLRAALAGAQIGRQRPRFHSTEVGTAPSDVVVRSPLV